MIGLALLAIAANQGVATSWEPRETTVVSAAVADHQPAPAPAVDVAAPAVASLPVAADAAEPVAHRISTLAAQPTVAASGPRAPPAHSA
jgi:hypothetical protein